MIYMSSYINNGIPIAPIDIDKLTQSTVINSLDMVGLLGPIILLFSALILLWENIIYWKAYTVIFTINVIFNRWLKTIFRQPRPPDGRRMLESETYTGIEQYGMPSGHAQSVLFSTTFLYLVKKSPGWLICNLFIVGLTVYQRWKYRQHTIEQISIGAAVGIIVGYIGYTMTTKWITGQI